jgi:hypothetical protein
MTKRTAMFVAVLGSAFASSINAQSTTINFDNVTSGTTISNQYAGVSFSAPAGFRTAAFASPLLGISSPNFLCSTPVAGFSCVGAFTVDFVNVVESVSVKAVGLDGSGQLMSVGVFGTAGLLGTLPVIGPGVVNSFVTLNFSSFGQIKRLEFSANTDGIGFDDLTFSTPTVVPEPSTMALLTAGVFGIALARRRRSSAGRRSALTTESRALALLQRR